VRPAEVDLLVGDASKAKRNLDWEPRVRFKELVTMMVEADLADLQRGSTDYPIPVKLSAPHSVLEPVIVPPSNGVPAIEVNQVKTA
jgi:hypothetical protein